MDDEHANDLGGTEYNVAPIGKDDPIRRGVIVIDGVRLRMSVFRERVSAVTGRPFFPIRLQYMHGEAMALKAAPVAPSDGEGAPR